MNDLKIVGERIKYCRESARENQEYIGSLIGVHKSTVSRWESGDTSKVGLPTIEILAKHFGVSPDWLSGKDVPMYDKVKNNGVLIEPPLNQHEADLIKAYRDKPDMQAAVDTLLGISANTMLAAQPQQPEETDKVTPMPEKQPTKIRRGYAAFGGDGWKSEIIEVDEKEVDAAFEKARALRAKNEAEEAEREQAYFRWLEEQEAQENSNRKSKRKRK